MKSQQQGVALLTVLFTVTLLTLFVAQLQARFQIDVDRTTWLLRDTQAREYALGAEQLARQLLWEDKQTLLQTAINRSPGPVPLLRFQPPHGEIYFEIADLQGLININNLGDSTNLDELVTTYLRDFMGMTGMEPLLRDWIDQDNTPRPGGGEDSYYEALPEPFKVANQLMLDPSEMIAAAGLEKQFFADHASALTTLPVPTPLNINAIQAELVAVINAELSPAQFRAARESLGGYFESVDDFLLSPVTAGLIIDSRLLTVDSQYYSIRVSARVDEHWHHFVSRVHLNPDTGRLELLDRRTVFSPPFSTTTMDYGHGEHADRIF